MLAAFNMEVIQQALQGAMGKYTEDPADLKVLAKFPDLRVHFLPEETKGGITRKDRWYFLTVDAIARYHKNGGTWTYDCHEFEDMRRRLL